MRLPITEASIRCSGHSMTRTACWRMPMRWACVSSSTSCPTTRPIGTHGSRRRSRVRPALWRARAITSRRVLANMVMLALPGSAYLYQGEELGLYRDPRMAPEPTWNPAVPSRRRNRVRGQRLGGGAPAAGRARDAHCHRPGHGRSTGQRCGLVHRPGAADRASLVREPSARVTPNSGPSALSVQSRCHKNSGAVDIGGDARCPPFPFSAGSQNVSSSWAMISTARSFVPERSR